MTASLNDTYKNVLKTMQEIHEAKNSDYGDSAHRTFEQFGLTAYLVRMQDKMNRLIALNQVVTAGQGRIQVEDEKLSDTLIDLANYAAMAASELINNTENEKYYGDGSGTLMCQR